MWGNHTVWNLRTWKIRMQKRDHVKIKVDSCISRG